MPELREAAALFLVATLLLGLVRVTLGPTPADRMAVAQMFGTGGTAVLVLLSIDHGPALRDVALLFALLAGVAAMAFVRWSTARTEGDPGG